MKALAARFAFASPYRRIAQHCRYYGLQKIALVASAILICLFVSSCDTGTDSSVHVIAEKTVEERLPRTTLPVANCSSSIPLETTVVVTRTFSIDLQVTVAPDSALDPRILAENISLFYRFGPAPTVVSLAVPVYVLPGSVVEFDIEWVKVIGEGMIEVGELDSKPEATYRIVETMFANVVDTRTEPCSAIAMTPTPTTTATVTSMSPTAVPTATTPTTLTDSIGRLEVTVPAEMVVGEAGIVTVEIMATPKFSSVGAHMPYATGVITIETKVGERVRERREQEIKLYPVMSVNLKAVGFDVEPNGDNRRVILDEQPAAWTWNLVPKNAGRQTITVDIYGEMDLKNEKFIVLEKSQSWDIKVVEKPLLKRVGDKIIDNLVAILGTGGPLALLILWLTYKSNKTSKELEKRVDALEERIPKRRPRKTDATEKTD